MKYKPVHFCRPPLSLGRMRRGCPFLGIYQKAPTGQEWNDQQSHELCLMLAVAEVKRRQGQLVAASRGRGPAPAGLSPGQPHVRRHSLALSAVALLHGRSLKKGRHFSQSTPKVLCLQLQTSLPSSFFTHSLACPLHLHLVQER